MVQHLGINHQLVDCLPKIFLSSRDFDCIEKLLNDIMFKLFTSHCKCRPLLAADFVGSASNSLSSVLIWATELLSRDLPSVNTALNGVNLILFLFVII